MFKERFPFVSSEDMDRYYFAIIELIKGRIERCTPVIIDNFGTFTMRKFPLKKVWNVSKNEYREIIPVRINLRPSKDFMEYFSDKKVRSLFIKTMLRKSKAFMKKYKNKTLI